MGRHAARRRGWFGGRWFGRGRTRALLSLGVVTALGATTTAAYWTDEGTIPGGTISSGVLDLTAGPVTGAENLTGVGPNNWDYAALAVSDMIPNESVSRTVVVRNSGTAPLRFNATVTSSTDDLTAGNHGLQVQVFDNSTAAAQTGTQAEGNREGSCSGGTQVFAAYVSTAVSGDVFPSDVTLAGTGDTRTLCLRAWLDSSAPNTLQSTTSQQRSTRVVLTLNAVQVGAP